MDTVRPRFDETQNDLFLGDFFFFWVKNMLHYKLSSSNKLRTDPIKKHLIEVILNNIN